MTLSAAYRPVFGRSSQHGDFTLHTHDDHCQVVDGAPPAPRDRATGEVTSSAAKLTSADGTSVLSQLSVPEGQGDARAGRVGFLVLPDIRGLHDYYRTLADRFAALGHPAVAIDWYARSAGTDDRSADFAWQPHFPDIQPADVDADAAAAVARLTAAGATRIVAVGFCFGGAQAVRLGAAGIGVDGSVGFYGPPRFVGDAADRVEVPVLLLLAGDDVATTPEEFDTFEQRLSAHNAHVQRVDYQGVPHSFFDREDPRWDDASQDAWRQLLAFAAALEQR